MNPGQHIDKKILTGLQSGKERIIVDTIRQLYINGTAEILPHLFKLYFTTASKMIRTEILSLLNDLKDKKSGPYFIEAVRTYKGQENYQKIVSACWQNGLDFSNDLKIFIDLVIEQDLLTAIEAFSVVEGNISEVSSPEREKFAIYIRSKLCAVDNSRKNLLNELLHVVENVSGPFKLHLN